MFTYLNFGDICRLIRDFFFCISETVLKGLHITAFNPHNMSMTYLLSVSFCRKINLIFIQISIPVSGKGKPRSPNGQLKGEPNIKLKSLT